MTLIPVPRPPKSAHNPERPINALLQAQIQHLHHAERNLPLRYRTEIYANAIKTEGEAAAYIRGVTEAIHSAHEDAAAQRTKRKRALTIAAAAEQPSRKRTSRSMSKKKRKGKSQR